MTSSDFRKSARENLAGKWGKVALLTLIYSLIQFAISLIASFVDKMIPLLSFATSIGLYIIQIPMAYGLIVSFIKIKRGEEVGYVDFFQYGFSQFKQVWCTVGNIALKLIVLIILIIVSCFAIGFGVGLTIAFLQTQLQTFVLGSALVLLIGLIGYIVCLIFLVPKSYSYALSFYLLHDHSDWKAKDIVEKSEQLMKGHRFELFVLGLTFIGWSILSVFTLGIGFLWLLPYIEIAFIIFYENRIESSKEEDSTKSSDTEIEA